MTSSELTEWVAYFKIKSDDQKRATMEAKAKAREQGVRNKRGR